MTRPSELSIVVPTCGREASLRRLLAALARQVDAPPFDVVVVLDGAPQPNLDPPDRHTWPFVLRIASQPPRGAAVARNTGARLALSKLLLFLDDDVEPGARTVRAHVDFHATHPRAIGAGDLAPVPTARGFIGMALTGWWESMCDHLRDPRHRFTFRDLLTGHCSIRRAVFDELGEFDNSLLCHEDFEFGYRALGAGVDIRFVEGTDTRHHDATTLEKVLRRKYEEGVADVQLVAKHPELLRALPLGRPLAGGRLVNRTFDAALRGKRRDMRFARNLLRLMRLFEAASMRDKWRSMLDRAMEFWYWRGATVHAGGEQAIRELRNRQGSEPIDPVTPVTVDLAAGLTQAEQQLDCERPQSIRVSLGRFEIGVLDEGPGFERLRGLHLRRILLHHFGDRFVAVAAQIGAVPSAFLDAVGQVKAEAGEAIRDDAARVA